MTGGTRQQRSLEKKRQLLDAAERVYYRDGDLGLTVRRLAAEASTTSQTIYTYFGSRDAVIEAMFERVLGDLDRLLTSVEAGPSAWTPGSAGGTGLLDLVGEYRRYCLAHPAQFQILATGRSPEGTDPDEVALRRQRLLGAIHRGGLATAPLTDEVVEGGARVLLAAIDGFIRAELDELIESNAPDKLFADLVAALAHC